MSASGTWLQKSCSRTFNLVPCNSRSTFSKLVQAAAKMNTQHFSGVQIYLLQTYLRCYWDSCPAVFYTIRLSLVTDHGVLPEPDQYLGSWSFQLGA